MISMKYEYDNSAVNIKKAILDHHDRKLIEDIEESKKMRRHVIDNFKEIQSYMKDKSIYNSATAFHIRYEMVDEMRW